MKVPLLDLSAQLKYMREDVLKAVTDVVDSTRYIGGPEVDSLEAEVADYCGAGYGVGVSSGTDALLASLMTLGIGPGDQVLTTPYSFFATMGVVLRVGAQPVFADIDPVSYNIDTTIMEEILAADTERKIKALLPVHLYGQCADMDPILALSEKYNIPVIEDAAQAIGAEYPSQAGGDITWKKAGSMGIAGCFSFFPSKNLGGIGDGGMVTSNDAQFAGDLALMRNHGAHPKYYHKRVGGNFRLDPIQATVLRIKLNYLEQWHGARRENALAYNALLEDRGLVDSGVVSLPSAVYQEVGDAVSAGKNHHIYNQYILRVKDRDRLRDWLLSNDIGCEVYYPVALHQQECLAGQQVKQRPLPHAEQAANETIALPIYPELTTEMQEYVVKTIATFYNQ